MTSRGELNRAWDVFFESLDQVEPGLRMVRVQSQAQQKRTEGLALQARAHP